MFENTLFLHNIPRTCLVIFATLLADYRPRAQPATWHDTSAVGRHLPLPHVQVGYRSGEDTLHTQM